jgi:hypothetical protein
MVKKNNKTLLYIAIVSISIIVIGIIIWGFMTNWKFWNHGKEKKTDAPPKLPEYKLNVPIQKHITKIEMVDPEKKGFKIGQEIQFGTGNKSETRTIVGFGSLILDAAIKYDHPKGTVIKVIKPTPTGKFSTKYCKIYDKNGECVKCFSDLKLMNGICVPDETCNPAICKTCNQHGNKCDICQNTIFEPDLNGKCCDHRHIIDGKCCDEQNICTIESQKICCKKGTKCIKNIKNIQGCCQEGESLDRYGVCCPKGQSLDNNLDCCSDDKKVDGICCKYDVLDGICSIKCNESSSCKSTQTCNIDGTCNDKQCEIDTKTRRHTHTISGDEIVSGTNYCKLSDATINKNNCEYPICYKKKGDGTLDYDGKQYTFRVNDSETIFQDYTEDSKDEKNNCTNANCGTGGTWDGNKCTIIKPCQINTNNACIFSDKERCCKDSSGNLTGQFCKDGEYCNDGKCIPKSCKGDSGLECSGHGTCKKGKCDCSKPPNEQGSGIPCCWNNQRICGGGKQCATWNDNC